MSLDKLNAEDLRDQERRWERRGDEKSEQLRAAQQRALDAQEEATRLMGDVLECSTRALVCRIIAEGAEERDRAGAA